MAHGPVLTRPEHVRRQKWSRAELPSISAAPQDNNKFVWNVTIMGDLDGGWYENGIYHLTLSFSPDFPEVHPRPRFATKMFHPQINEDGFPYLSVSMADSKVSALARQCWHGRVQVIAVSAVALRGLPAAVRVVFVAVLIRAHVFRMSWSSCKTSMLSSRALRTPTQEHG